LLIFVRRSVGSANQKRYAALKPELAQAGFRFSCVGPFLVAFLF
jgi:hypothetical protein